MDYYLETLDTERILCYLYFPVCTFHLANYPWNWIFERICHPLDLPSDHHLHDCIHQGSITLDRNVE